MSSKKITKKPKEEVLSDEKGFYLPHKPGIFLFVGKPRSGKTVAMKSILYKYFKEGYFKFGLAITTTAYNNSYNFLPSENVWPEWNEERFFKYIAGIEEQLRKAKQTDPTITKPPPNFLVLDDCFGLLNLYDSPFVNFIAKYRHLNLSLFITAQYLPGFSTQMREAVTASFIYRTRFGNSLKMLSQAFGSGMKQEEFQQLLEEATSEDYYALVFINDQKREHTYHAWRADVAPDFRVVFKGQQKQTQGSAPLPGR